MWMGGWLTLMLTMLVAARASARELGTFQILEVRSLIGMVMLIPLIHLEGGLRAMKTHRIGAHISRNLAHFTGQFCWFLALTMIPLSQLIAIEFTMPIWAALLSLYFFGERMNAPKIWAIVLGIIGVLIIVRPIGKSIDPGQLIMLAGAVGFGISIVLVKSLTTTESAVKIIFWMLIIQSLLGFVPAFNEWVWPSYSVWGWMLIVAFTGTFSHYCMAKAMLYADTMIVVPLDFLRLPLSALIGWLLYAESLDVYTAIGAALILSGNFFNLKAPRQAVPATSGAAGS